VEPEWSPAPDMADSSRSPQPRSEMANRSGYLPVSEHGLIGDLHTLALVGTNGTIDWHCSPSFVWVRDAAFCVYALLRLGFASEADAFVRFNSQARHRGRSWRLWRDAAHVRH
jgi:GH15 family glucan-1,4-alpha-glucosidase